MNSMFALFNMGGMEIVLILAVILLFFGGSKLPGLARGLGQSVKEFKKGMSTDPNEKPKTDVEKATAEKK